MEQLINKAVAYVQDFFAEDHSGHDAQHTLRVWRTAKRIAAEEGADQLTVQLAALLHDVDDRKLSPETWQEKRHARQFMQESGVDEAVQGHVLSIISSISFSAGLVPDTLEGKIVQDADRLDAMGAIGIARTFAYGGSHGRTMYDPAEKPDEHMSRQEYAARTSSSINHFYEKLLKLKDEMNTPAGRAMAQQRHAYMEAYLQEFFEECEGIR